MPEQQSDYERVIDTITERVESGQYPPGGKLPSISQLAVEFNTSQTTIKNAQMVLRRIGVLRGHPGKGVYVADRRGDAAGRATNDAR